MRTSSQAASDVGRKRTNNEDACFADDEAGLYAVADGVGGGNSGEVASRVFVETVQAALVPGGTSAGGAAILTASGYVVARRRFGWEPRER